jgi:cyanophycin synthetase
MSASRTEEVVSRRAVAKAEKTAPRRRKSKPAPDLRILETRVFRGPNYWSYEPAIKLVVDLGVLEQFPSNTIPGFVDGLLDLVPGVATHSCGTGKAGGFEKRLREGTWVGHVAEHIALQLQREAGTEVGRGKTRSADQPGRYHVV